MMEKGWSYEHSLSKTTSSNLAEIKQKVQVFVYVEMNTLDVTIWLALSNVKEQRAD
jgi:hypothetical protein